MLLYDTLNNICSSMDSCLIYGDFNLAGIDWISGTYRPLWKYINTISFYHTV